MNRYLKASALSATVFSGVYFEFWGLSFNIERLFSIFLSIFIAYAIFTQIIRNDLKNNYKFSWLFLLWGFSLSVSLFLSNGILSHLSGYVICVLPIFLFFLFSTSSNNESVLEMVHVPILLYLSIGGIVVYLIAILGDRGLVSEFVGNLSNSYSVKLTVIEPNIYGATLSYFLIMHYYKFRPTLKNLIVYFIAIIAITLSFSRGPYIGFLAGTFAYLMLTGKFRKLNFIAFTSIFTVIVCSFLISMPDVFLDIYEDNLNRQGTIGSRMIVLQYAMERFFDNPIFGNGPLDFPISMSFVMTILGAADARNISIWQMFVGIAHDSGIVGLIFYVTFLLGLFYHGYRAVFRGQRELRASYFAGFLSLFVASQTTTTYYTALFGIAMGLLSSGYVKKQLKTDG